MKIKINLSTIVGLVAAGLVIYLGVFARAANSEIFLDNHAMILVFGGTFAAAMIAYPFRQFGELWSFLTAGAMFPSEKKHLAAAEHLLFLSNHPPLTQIEPEMRRAFHPFLLEGYSLMQKEGWSAAEFKMLLQSRSQQFKERYGRDARVLTALAKFPPAFGLLGATSGMIAMMSNLGPTARENIGPSMAIALVATFWGIAAANLVLLPLADHAVSLNAEDDRLRRMIASGLMLIHQGARPAAIFEHLLAYLPLEERNNPSVKKMLVTADSKSRVSQRSSQDVA